MYLKKSLQGVIPEKLLNRLIGSYDVVGDIAVTIIPSELRQYEPIIGQAILDSNKKIKVVLKRAGRYSGKFRTLKLHHIAGEHRFETIAVEYGIKIQVNLEQVYYSVRSGNERRRVAELIAPDELILVMFSGIAPYPLMLSKFSEARLINGIEHNKIAHQYGLMNIKKNNVSNVRLLQGDAGTVTQNLKRQFDRIVMPLPESSLNYLSIALKALKERGTIHLYLFSSKKVFSDIENNIEQICKDNGQVLVSSKPHLCGHKSPTIYRLCLDLKITR